MSLSTSPSEETVLKSNASRGTHWIGGFFLAGALLGSIGSLLIAWQYHLGTDPRLIGLHFLALNAGYLAAAILSRIVLARIPARLAAAGASLLGFFAYAALSWLAPPAAVPWRILALGFLGFAGGGLISALLYGLRSHFTGRPGEITSRAGVFFGLGCLVATLIVGTTYFIGSIRVQTLLLAAIPLCYCAVYLRERSGPSATHTLDAPAISVRALAPVLFTLLLFFQFGNEWSIAGWLPFFLIRHLGSNPDGAIFLLAIYFATLMLGRMLAEWLLKHGVPRKLLLPASICAALAGCIFLSLTISMREAVAAVVLIGLGFAPVYPLAVRSLDHRFSFHPAFYNSIFSVAITGALCAPWLLGYVDAYLGVEYLVLLPAFGLIAVLVLAFLLTLEARLFRKQAAAGQA